VPLWGHSLRGLRGALGVRALATRESEGRERARGGTSELAGRPVLYYCTHQTLLRDSTARLSDLRAQLSAVSRPVGVPRRRRPPVGRSPDQKLHLCARRMAWRGGITHTHTHTHTHAPSSDTALCCAIEMRSFAPFDLFTFLSWFFTTSGFSLLP
jgi:hypothetical protein